MKKQLLRYCNSNTAFISWDLETVMVIIFIWINQNSTGCSRSRSTHKIDLCIFFNIKNSNTNFFSFKQNQGPTPVYIAWFNSYGSLSIESTYGKNKPMIKAWIDKKIPEFINLVTREGRHSLICQEMSQCRHFQWYRMLWSIWCITNEILDLIVV